MTSKNESSRREQHQKIDKNDRGNENKSQNDNENMRSMLKGKQTRQSSHKSVTRASESLKLIHSDLCESIDSTIYDKTNYYVLFIDDFIKMSHIYSLKRKSSADVLEKFKEYKLEMKKQTRKSIKRLRTNDNREYEK